MEVVRETQEAENLLSPIQKSKLLYRNFPLKDFRGALPGKETINDFIYIANDHILLLACFKKIFEYNLHSKTITRTIQAHDTNVSALVEIPNQYLIVSGGYDGALILWEQNRWKIRREYNWGGWIYNLVALPNDGVVGFIAGHKDDRHDCIFGVWNYNFGELVIKVYVDIPGNHLISKYCWLDQGKEMIMADKYNDLHHIIVRSGKTTHLRIGKLDNPITQISAICAYEVVKKRPGPAQDLVKLIQDLQLQGTKLIEDLQLPGTKLFQDLQLQETVTQPEPEENKILLFIGGYKGTMVVLKTNRKFEEFVELERREIGDKQINHIELLKPTEKDKVLFVRSGEMCFLFDMDFTMIHSFNLGVGNRITKEFISLGVDEKFFFTSSKGDIVTYKMENLIKYFLLKLMVLKSNEYHPYIYVEVFNMLFSNDNINV